MSYDKTQIANFGGNPPFQAKKTTLEQQLSGEKSDVGHLPAFG